MKALSIVAAAILMSATGAMAEEPNADADAAAKQEKKICKTEKMTGSLTRVKRTCLTQSQWAQLNEVNRKGVGDFVRQSDHNQSPGRGMTHAAD